MKVMKFYDVPCDKCGNWYTVFFKPPFVSNAKLAAKEMKNNGWIEKNGVILCHECKEYVE